MIADYLFFYMFFRSDEHDKTALASYALDAWKAAFGSDEHWLCWGGMLLGDIPDVDRDAINALIGANSKLANAASDTRIQRRAGGWSPIGLTDALNPLADRHVAYLVNARGAGHSFWYPKVVPALDGIEALMCRQFNLAGAAEAVHEISFRVWTHDREAVAAIQKDFRTNARALVEKFFPARTGSEWLKVFFDHSDARARILAATEAVESRSEKIGRALVKIRAERAPPYMADPEEWRVTLNILSPRSGRNGGTFSMEPWISAKIRLALLHKIGELRS